MRQKFFVLSQRGRWAVGWEGSPTRTVFDNKNDAIKHARMTVGKFPEGYCSQILVQKMDGTWQTEWTYGKDPFPPRG